MLSKGIIYYTDNRLDETIFRACQRQLQKVGYPIVSVSLQPLDFGENYVLPLERSYLTMFKQILLALEKSKADVIYFCEHDVIYHLSHFEFNPSDERVYYYNRNNWKVRYPDGQALFYICEQTLGLCGYRELILHHYRERVRRVEVEGFSRRMGFEPGKHHLPEGVDNFPWSYWMSEFPNLDVRHDRNLTANRWSQDQFRDQRNCQGWIMTDEVPGWGRTKGMIKEILKTI